MSPRCESESLGLIAWARNPGRFLDIAAMLDIEPRIIDFPRLRARWSAPLRYPIAVVLTLAWLLRRRPRVVIVCCPPPFAATLVAIYARVFDASYILDAHPGAFGHRDRLWRLFVPLQRWLVHRARMTMVTEPTLGEVVDRWGGRPLIFHEAPPSAAPTLTQRSNASSRPTVLFATVFDPDEPVEVITEAAGFLSECDVLITGAESRLARGYRDQLARASHIHLTGWLEQRQYLEVVAAADVVVALTTDPHSVMRSAFEAVYLRRPTVLSDTKTLRECFSPSVFVESTPASVTEGVRAALAEHASWLARAEPRRDELLRRSADQREKLEAAIDEGLRRAPRGATVLARS